MEPKIIETTYSQLIKLKEEILSCVDQTNSNQSIQNLQAYIKLRSLDLRELQNHLTNLGLSSLGRAQSCVINSINQDILILSKLLHKPYKQTQNDLDVLNYDDAKNIMLKNSEVFGKSDTSFKTKVMVTLPSEASNSPELISKLIANGTSVFRINTAHDDASTWNKMASYIKEENEKQNKQTKIYVDLAGPKNRTQPIIKVFTPFKIGSWRVPKLVEVVPVSQQEAFTKKYEKNTRSAVQATLVVSHDFFQVCKSSSKVKIDDFERDARQYYCIIKKDDRIFLEVNKKITIYENTTMEIKDENHKYISCFYNIEKLSKDIKLYKGNQIIITNQDILGDSDYSYENIVYDAIIGCSNKEIFPYVNRGDDIYIDDGKIGCKVLAINEIGLVCEVFLAKENGTSLKEEKGINFPSTDLKIDAITPTDEKNFEDIVEFADMIGLSFAQTAEDIKKLQNMLKFKNKQHIAIAPKIETKTALKNLPLILEKLLEWENHALMIARGDLAIEVGFDNLPYIQEEILNICEASHTPVIYATQILEGKMKNNLPSRAEVTDAAIAQRADCVMLNKGPYVTDTVIVIKNILRQMHTLFQKNRQLFSICQAWKVN